jgi:hypothetical protein
MRENKLFYGNGQREEAYETVKMFFGVDTSKCRTTENKEGEVIYEEKQVIN